MFIKLCKWFILYQNKLNISHTIQIHIFTKYRNGNQNTLVTKKTTKNMLTCVQNDNILIKVYLSICH